MALASTSKQGVRGRLYRATRELIAIAFWSYVVTKVFLFDLDYWLLSNYAPHLRWLADYRFVWYLLILAAIVLAASRLGALGFVLFVAFYPFVLVFWRLPRFLRRLNSWTIALALLAGIVSLVRSVKFTVVATASLVVGTVLTVAVQSHALIALGGGLLLISLAGVYGKTIAGSFKSTFDFFSVSVLAKVWGFAEKSFISDQGVENLSVEPMGETEVQKWTNALGVAVVCNRGCYFLASKLRELRRSRLLAAVYMARVLGLFGLSVYVFSFVNFGLYRVSPASFSADGAQGGFDFVWYTFNSVFGNGVAGLAPASTLAKVVFMATTAFGLLILFVVVVFLITAVQSNRDNERMNEMVDEINRQGRDLDAYLGSEFGMSIDEAVDRLRRAKTGVLSLVYYFSPELRPDEEAVTVATSIPPIASGTHDSK